MLKAFRPLPARSLVFCILACIFAALAAPQAHAQSTTGNPALDRQLSRLDLGVNAFGSITKDVQGTNYLGIHLTQKAATTVGALVTVRYTKSPWIGGEFNYAYARYTQNFTNTTNSTVTTQYVIGGAQTNANEYTLGYVAHPNHPILGAQPFFSIGAGSTAFRPTPGGGQGLPAQARMTYYYAVGAEKVVFGDHLGARVQLRQTFFKAPDFGQNYLTIQQRTWTVEPAFGFFLRF